MDQWHRRMHDSRIRYALVLVLKADFEEIPWQAKLAVAVFFEKQLNKQIKYSAGYQAK